MVTWGIHKALGTVWSMLKRVEQGAKCDWIFARKQKDFQLPAREILRFRDVLFTRMQMKLPSETKQFLDCIVHFIKYYARHISSTVSRHVYKFTSVKCNHKNIEITHTYKIVIFSDMEFFCARVARHSDSHRYVRQMAVIAENNMSLWSSKDVPMYRLVLQLCLLRRGVFR
jgi:hypothetical protein